MPRRIFAALEQLIPNSALPYLRTVRKWTALSIATGIFIGFFPFAPGTFGTALAVAGIWGFGLSSAWTIGFLAVLFYGLGVWACTYAAETLGEPDAPPIVIDEIVGMLVTMIGIPVSGYWLIWGFVLFRVFDIVKPPPAAFLDERVKTGWGVMSDDVVAGLYANGLLHLMVRASVN